MAEKVKEEYSAEGRVIVDESVFEEPGEEAATQDTTTPEETTQETTTPEETVNPEETITPKEGEEPTKPAEGEETKTKEGEEGKEPEILFAGKFKTEDELKKAYQTLGGDPSKFKTIKALEEAYDYRQGEYTRIQQEQAERDRIANLVPNTPHNEPVAPNAPITADDMMKKVDWTKVTDAQTLGQELFKIMLEAIPKAQAVDPTTQLTPEQLVERIAPIIKEREEKMAALSEIETEVPRLKKDPAFRKAYAYHVVGGRADGTKYPKTKEGLKEAMKDFLSWGKSIAEESARQTTVNAASKKSAIQAPEAGGSMPGAAKGDEADDIISAYAENQKKYNFGK